MQAAFVKHDGFQCGYCTPGQICSAVAMLDEIKAGIPSHVTADLTRAAATHRRRDARAHERQHLPLRRLFQHRRGDHRSRREEGMKAFTYERAASPAEAAAAAARKPGAKFIAGGTNLLDLMKLEIETPTHLIDVNGLGARQDRSRRPRAACASARWCATPISPRMSACGATMACSPARCSPAPRASCATRRRPPAICSSGRAAPISTTPISRATSARPAAAARRIGGFSRQHAVVGVERRLHRDASERHGGRDARARRDGGDGAAGWRRRGRFRSPSSIGCPATRRTSKRC